MTKRASGTFEVKLNPQGPDAHGEAALGRLSIDKQFNGDLAAASTGQMLTGGTDVQGSAVYVAVEKVTGTLDGREGTFILHHTGIMRRGVPELTISVAPDSGTGALAGLDGQMGIRIVERQHHYDFDYTLPDE
jgi:hypothetical protein